MTIISPIIILWSCHGGRVSQHLSFHSRCSNTTMSSHLCLCQTREFSARSTKQPKTIRRRQRVRVPHTERPLQRQTALLCRPFKQPFAPLALSQPLNERRSSSAGPTSTGPLWDAAALRFLGQTGFRAVIMIPLCGLTHRERSLICGVNGCFWELQ